MGLFGREGGSRLFYPPQHLLEGDGVKVTACHSSRSFLWREADCCLVLGPPTRPLQFIGTRDHSLTVPPGPGRGQRQAWAYYQVPNRKESGYVRSQTLLQVMADFSRSHIKKM